MLIKAVTIIAIAGCVYLYLEGLLVGIVKIVALTIALTALLIICGYICLKQHWMRKSDELVNYLTNSLDLINAKDDDFEYIICKLQYNEFILLIKIPPENKYKKQSEAIATQYGKIVIAWLMRNGFKGIFKAAQSNVIAFRIIVGSITKGVTGEEILHYCGTLIYDPCDDSVVWNDMERQVLKGDDFFGLTRNF